MSQMTGMFHLNFKSFKNDSRTLSINVASGIPPFFLWSCTSLMRINLTEYNTRKSLILMHTCIYIIYTCIYCWYTKNWLFGDFEWTSWFNGSNIESKTKKEKSCTSLVLKCWIHLFFHFSRMKILLHVLWVIKPIL